MGTLGRPCSGAKPALLMPVLLEAKAPTSVPTRTCGPRTATQVAGASGRFLLTSVNVSPASRDTKRWPVPTASLTSPSVPGGVQRRV